MCNSRDDEYYFFFISDINLKKKKSNSNTTGVTSGTWTTNTSGETEFTTGF